MSTLGAFLSVREVFYRIANDLEVIRYCSYDNCNIKTSTGVNKLNYFSFFVNLGNVVDDFDCISMFFCHQLLVDYLDAFFDRHYGLD